MGDGEAKSEVDETVDSAVEPNSPWQSVRLLIDLNWWRHSFATALSFAPYCIVPAGFSALAGATVNVSLLVGFDRLRVNPVELTDLLLAMGVLLMGSILGLAFLILGFGSWLFKLAAYSMALINAPSISHLGCLSQVDRKDALKSAIAAVEPKQVHIGAVLVWVTVYMLAPFLVVLICTGIKMVTMPSVVGPMALTLPDWVDYACAVAVLPNFLFLVIFSFVSLVVAASVPVKAQQSAHFAFKLSWQFFWPLSLVCLFFVLFSFALGAPSDLVQMLTLEKVMKEYDPVAKILAHVWASLLSILLFPLSFTPVCDILRPHLRSVLLADAATSGTVSAAPDAGASADVVAPADTDDHAHAAGVVEQMPDTQSERGTSQ